MDRQCNKNYYILMYDAAAYATFCALWDVNTVIPVFLDQMGSPFWLIGVTYALKQLGYLSPQPIVASLLHRVSSLTGFIRKVVIIDRPQLLIFLLALWLVANNRAVLVIFFICFTILCFGEGTLLVPWMDLMGRSLKAGTRGRFWGSIQIAGGLAALGAGLVISKVIDSPDYPYPHNFLVIFGLGAFIVLPPLILFGFAEDPFLPLTRSHPGWGQSVLKCFNNRHFLLLLVVQHLAGFDALAIPHYIIMVRHKFAWMSHYTGAFIVLGILGGVVGGLLWGILSDRPNSYRTVVSITFFKAAASGIFLAAQFAQGRVLLPYAFGTGFFMVGIVTAAWVGFLNHILNIATHSERPFYIAMNNTVLLPVAFFPVLGGVIRQYSGDAVLCAVTTLATAGAFAFSLRLKNLS